MEEMFCKLDCKYYKDFYLVFFLKYLVINKDLWNVVFYILYDEKKMIVILNFLKMIENLI